MINLTNFGHINIVVDDIEKASRFYENLFNAKQIQYFPHFKNKGFACSAGFLDSPDKVDVSINFLKFPNMDIILELMCYHYPVNKEKIIHFKPHDLGGIRHICFRVENIEMAFNYIKELKGVQLLVNSPSYKPYKLSEVTTNEFIFWDEKINKNLKLKQQSAEVSCGISFFYFRDQYGVLWELEEVPEEIEDIAIE